MKQSFKMKIFVTALMMTLGLSSLANAEKVVDTKSTGLSVGLYVLFLTSKGPIVAQLFAQDCPKTIDNFVGLAEGTRTWLDPETLLPIHDRSIYAKTIFHRVIPNFMIQGGDPTGTGRGGPGYKFKDEIVDTIAFDRPGRLAMANSGPNTNGSQFFMTHGPCPWLDGKHTIFGQVVQGQNVVNEIGSVPRDDDDRPIKPVVLESVEIFRVEETVETVPTVDASVSVTVSSDATANVTGDLKKP